ncbi:MAG: phosphoenolpyruvate--protein phosphotransferase [Gammaproteobacteria bacterium]|nr:MAG: phosphoenolpyruvate--protein phosphotransferase [Gammaproteobacteria bacterium]
MLALYGTGVSNGISIGKAYVLQSSKPQIIEQVLPEHKVDNEVEHFLRSVEIVRRELQEIRKHIPMNAPPETAGFVDMHLMILEDTMLSDAPIAMIREQRLNAAWALQKQSDLLCNKFDKMDDPYLRNKKNDIIQVVNRVLRVLLGMYESTTKIQAGHIIIANDLAPADTVLFKKNKIKAFVTDLGGPISHTAILARSLGIPAIVALHQSTSYIRTGDDIIVDGNKGVLTINPDKATISYYKKRKSQSRLSKYEFDSLKRKKSQTHDRKKIKLLANIELPGDITAAMNSGAAGIGLYRTEFLFMNRVNPPGEEEQYRAYTKVIKRFPNMPVTIRTLDIGADKPTNSVPGAIDIRSNPAMGLRAIRLCLSDTSLFKPQLKAIFRASIHGKVQLMIPMLSNLDELFRVFDLIDEVQHELKRSKTYFNANIPVGGMIEVPAAAIAAQAFSKHLDFMSIGTNDLIQYTLAIDRVNDAVNYLYDPSHPAILQLIANTIKAGRAANIPVAMCGEMAGDPKYIRLLLGMGLREFSMHPAMLMDIKKIIRKSNTSELGKQASRLLKLHSNEKIREMLDTINTLDR